ncbi:MAG: hypothetical protein WBF84_07460 [Castellaniella sp.]|uniref:4'-phosphopantetheinyl transferase family protein n=1 Tax=Castellaniella sp. TaxID=1955812 RepID=UPI003C74F526
MTARNAVAGGAPWTQGGPAPATDSDAPYQLTLSQGLPDEAGAMRLRQDLPEAEWHWITRLRRPEDRLRSLTGRALARRLLGLRLGLAPEAVPLTTGPHGKPMLAGPDPAWHFNIAHSGDLILVGVGPQPLGVDVEHCPDRVSADLWRMVTGVSDATLDPRVFCAHWVRREAVLKTCGLGLTVEPGALRIATPDTTGWAQALGHPAVEGLWVQLLRTAPGHCAALCLSGPPPHNARTLKTLELADWIEAQG